LCQVDAEKDQVMYAKAGLQESGTIFEGNSEHIDRHESVTVSGTCAPLLGRQRFSRFRKRIKPGRENHHGEAQDLAHGKRPQHESELRIRWRKIR
jgi:hypothetical protein